MTFTPRVKNAPDLKKAQANLLQAEGDLDQAKLDLRYYHHRGGNRWRGDPAQCEPGNNVQVGQSLMAVRSLTDIWVDANFKETQLRDLRIGQRVDLEVDMYGGNGHSRDAFPALRMGTDPLWRCCRRKMRRAISSRWCSGCRCESTCEL